MLVRRRSQQDNHGSDWVVLQGIDLRVESDIAQSGRKGLVEAGVGMADTLWIFVSPHDQRLPRRLPQQGDQVLILRGIHRICQLVEAERDIRFNRVVGQHTESEPSVGPIPTKCSIGRPLYTPLPRPTLSTDAGWSASRREDRTARPSSWWTWEGGSGGVMVSH